MVVGNLSYERKSSDHVYISGLMVVQNSKGRVAREVLTRLLKELKDVKRVDLVTHPEIKSSSIISIPSFLLNQERKITLAMVNRDLFS